MRPLTIVKDYTDYPHGSVLVNAGNTRVICTATLEEAVPPFLRESGRGWVTAEYAMLPGSTRGRKPRDRGKGTDGRSAEIQRLIGRSLRTAVELSALGERTIWIDCDVIQADGGTRCASITGGAVALALACRRMAEKGLLAVNPFRNLVAAVSLVVLKKTLIVDPCYKEDSAGEVDMNIVMAETGEFVEIQGTGEEKTFSQDQLSEMLSRAHEAINRIFDIQRSVIS